MLVFGLLFLIYVFLSYVLSFSYPLLAPLLSFPLKLLSQEVVLHVLSNSP